MSRPVLFMIRKGHPIAPKLRKFVQLVFEMGLTSPNGKWEYDFAYDIFTQFGKWVVYRKPEYVARPLKMEDVIGAFYILIAGWVIAFISLVFERRMGNSLLQKRFVRNKRLRNDTNTLVAFGVGNPMDQLWHFRRPTSGWSNTVGPPLASQQCTSVGLPMMGDEILSCDDQNSQSRRQ